MSAAGRGGYLFVYGSLRSATPAGVRTDEARAAFGMMKAHGRRLGEGSVQGRLYAVSWYPGYVPGRRSSERVTGEVWTITDAGAVFPALDAFEGAEYVRRRRVVRMADGSRISAWVYVHVDDLHGAPHIESGDYAGWLKAHGTVS